ncbi:uncharacterized protein [Phyllobates terribilis]|uniref:uncharacterized protein isoform X3 n=1 Tax=Phyllobates terribilis TaxID=111132 RepID=UPI003CCB1163
MGTNRRLLISIGSLLLFLTCIHAQDWDSVEQDYENFNFQDFDPSDMQQTVDPVDEDDEDVQQQSDGGPSRVNIIASPPPVYRSLNPSHNQKICSTFGNHNYKTFDGDIFHFKGHCSYQFARHCKTNYEDFFVGIKREVGETAIFGIYLKIDGVDISLTKETVIVNNEVVVELPFSNGGTQIFKTGSYKTVSSKIGFVLVWNEEDAVTLELSSKYANQTCGLCGDYNGIPMYNEFIMNNAHLTNHQYGNLQKYHNPEEEKCEDLKEEADTKCSRDKKICTSVLTGAPFRECNKKVDVWKYIALCENDMCRCTENTTWTCLCNIFTAYSRECTHAGSEPKNWRSSKLCPRKCAYNLQFKECGTACPDTCSNPEHSSVCDDHCTDGCVCPAGMVFDDIRKTGCIPKEQCACTHNGDVYPSGAGYSEKCQDCKCNGGKWSCVKKACLGVCALEGGSHITTFDKTRYNFHGDCTYTLIKTRDSNLFSVFAELYKCGTTDTQTCLKSISLSLNGGKEIITVEKCGSMHFNNKSTQMPHETASAYIFSSSTFYIMIQAKNKEFQVKVQLKPTMQAYVYSDPKHMNKIWGLCGNFNEIQADDFESPAGVREGTGSSFGNLWKTRADCPNVRNNFEDPCSLMGQNEQYASHHCDLLLASDGPFASGHKTVDPEPYHKNCMFDACNCDNKKEDCMCSAISSYVSACSREGVVLRGWRTQICQSYTTTCKPGHKYSDNISTCMPSCRALSERDATCEYDIGILDGCICEDGKYQDGNGNCVLLAECPCYKKGTNMSPGEVISENGAICTCTNGKIDCVGENPVEQKVCDYPKVYFDCDNATAGAKGSECQKSCSTFDNDCHSSGCVSGCVCPEGLFFDEGRDLCISEEKCSCQLNGDYYLPGDTVQVKCNTCTCKNRKWTCTTETCLGTCAVYGDGHYLTFDSRRYRFNGNCKYTLVQDYCSNDATKGTFRILTENEPCGSQGTTCSKSIILFLGNYELIMDNKKFDVVKRDSGIYEPFKVHQMGIYLVVEAKNGLALVWDKKTTMFVKMDPKYQGKVCGLCGNYDGNTANDYMTRSQSVIGDVLEFGNSWKISPSCPDAVEITDTCASNPYRKAWSQRQCSIITSGTFASCHSLVEPMKYYEACVTDACACDSGGDCDCLCTAVAAYAQACSEAGQCIHWRTPNICPVFCDFYNQQGHCEWHYKACGAPCMKTCMNPTGVCYNKLIGLEGCYPTCPEDRPFFDEESMQCVSSCNCFDEYGVEYKPGEKMPGPNRCSVCTCTKEGRTCTPASACCYYEGQEFLPGDIIYSTSDAMGGCLHAICTENSTIERMIAPCSTTVAPTTAFDFTSSSTYDGQSTPSTPHEGTATSSASTESSPGTSGEKGTERPVTSTSSSETPPSPTGESNTSKEVPTVSPTPCVEARDCTWSEWYDVGKPENNEGDFERFTDIESQGHKLCKTPRNVQCRAKDYPDVELKDLGQDVTCSRRTGLVCLNSKNPEMCYNYEMRIECCKYSECTATSSSTSTEQTSSPTSSVSIKPPSPTTKEHPTSLPVQVTSSETSHPTDTAASSEITPSETSTLRTSGETTPQQQKTSNSPSTTLTGTPETSSSVIDKTSKSSEVTTKTPTPAPTTRCVYKMECRWTPWYDSNALNTKSDGGDFENIDYMKSKGFELCTKQEFENNIECEAINENRLAIANNNQKYSCDLVYGLKCENRDQSNKKKCSNYQIRIECCQKVCETPEVITTETTEPGTNSGEMTTQGTTSAESEPSQVSTRPPSSTPLTPLTTEKPSIEVTPSPPTLCVYKMDCRWTEWFDDNKPNSKSDGGDTESIARIKSEGRGVCETWEVEDKVECEAIDGKNVSIINNNQKFKCSLEDGVICKNRDQISKGKCYNYRMKVLCCGKVCESVPTPTISTTETSEPTTVSGEITSHGISTTTLPEHGSTGISSTQKPDISSSSEGTSPPSTSSTEVTTSFTSTTATCIYKTKCRWTTWYDMNKPTYENDGGESESPEDIKSKGNEICKNLEVEQMIECEAVDHDGVTIANNQQILTCALKSGLSCKNSDQEKEEPCNNYRVRVQCCASYCEPVVTSTISNPVATQSSSPTTSLVTEPALTSGKDCANERELECRWTQWYNESKPSKEFNGEENENSDKIKSAGWEICRQGEVENQIECKNEHHSETASEQYLAQKTTCNVKNGLICKNQDQSGESCHDYSIRYECCSENFMKTCGESTTPSSTEVTSVTTTISITQPSSSETLPHSTSVTGTKVPETSSETTPVSITEVPSSPSSTSSEVTSATSSPTTACIKKMDCRWTSWYDNNFPSSEVDGEDEGDAENAQDIKANGQQICNQHEVQHNIKCEAINEKGAVISGNQQTMTCDLKNGLSCLNKDQKNKEKCHNYRIQFECCAEVCDEDTPKTTLATTSSTSKTEFTSEESTSPVSSESPSPSDTKSPTSTTGVSSTPTTSSTTKTEITSPTPATITSCEKFRENECRWTDWLNTDEPSKHISGEDVESSEKSRSFGTEVCKNEEVENKIECKAAQHPYSSYEEIGQNVKCNLKEGFVCKNNEQSGETKQCLDYEIRIECCSKKFIESCEKTTPYPTSPSSSEITESPITTSITELSSQSSGESTPGQPITGEQPITGKTPGKTSSSEKQTANEQPTPDITPGQTSSSSERPTTGEQPTTGTTPDQTSSSEKLTSSEKPTTGTTPGQTSSSDKTTIGDQQNKSTTSRQTTSSERTTSGEQPTIITRPGQTSSSERPTTDEQQTIGTSEIPTSRETSTTGEQGTTGTTPGQTSSSESPTTGEQPNKGTSPGKTSSSERPTSGEKSTTGEQGTTGTTPGQTSSSERPTSGEKSTTGEEGNTGTTPGRTSSSESPTSGEKSTTGEEGNTGTTTSQTSSSERPTSGEKSTTGEPGTTGTKPGQTSSSESPTSGEKSTTGEPVITGTTPGQTSSSESPTTGEQPNKGTSPGQTSSSESPTSGEKSTTGEQGTTGTTPGQTSSSESPTTGEQPSKGTSTGETSSFETPTSGEKSTTGEQGTTGTTPGQTSSSERPTSGEKSTTGETGTTGTTPGQTSSSESPTSGEKSTTGEQGNTGTTTGQTSSSEKPTSGEKSTTGEPGITGTTPGQTSSSESPTTGEQPNKGTSPGQTSSSERPTSGEKSTTGEQGTTGTTPGQTSSSEKPTSGEKSTTGETGNTGTTPGQTSSSESPTSGEKSTTGEPGITGTTPGQTSSSESPTTGEQPNKGTSPGQTSSSESPTSGEKSTTGEQGTTGTTPGQTSSSERPTSGEKSTTGETGTTGTTPGQTSSSESPTSGEKSTTGEQGNTGTTTGQTSSSEKPTSGEKSTTGEPGITGTTPGQTSSSESPTTGEQPNKGTSPGQTSSSERPTSGEKSTTGEQGTTGTTPGQTSSSEKPTSGEKSTTGETGTTGTTPGQTSSSESPTSGEKSTTGEPGITGTTPGQTSSSESPTTGEQPNKGTSPGQTSSSESPTSGEKSTTGEQGTTGTTPGQTSSSESLTTGEQPNKGTSPGQTSSSERPTSGEKSTTGEQETTGTTPGQTSSSERPTSGEKSTAGEPGTTGTTPGQTSSSESPTTGEQPSKGTSPGQTSSSESPTSGEKSTTGEPGTTGTTPGQTSSSESRTTGEQPNKGTSPGQTSSSEGPTSGEKSTTGEQGTTGTTPGQTSSSERLTSGEKSTTGEQGTTGTTPGQTSSSESPTTGEQPNKGTSPGQTSSSERPTSGEKSTTGEQGTTGTTPGQTSSSESPTTGEQPNKGTSPGQTSSSERPTSGEKSTTGEQGTTGTTPGQTSSSESPTTGEQPNKGTSPGQTSSSERPTSGEKSTTGEQGNTGTTPGQTSSSERSTSGEKSTTGEKGTTGITPGQTSSSESPTTGEQPNKGTSPGQTSSFERPTSGEKSTTGEPGTTGTTPGQTSSSESPITGEQPNKGTSPGQTSSSERPTSGEKSTTGEQGTTVTTPGQTSSSERPTSGEKSTTGEQGTTGTTPGQTSSSERSTSGEKSTTGEQGTTGITPGQTSSSERPTTGEQPNKGTSPGQTSSSESPTSGEKSTTGEQGTTGTTPGQTSSSESPTTGEQPNKGTSPGQTSSSERLTSGEKSTTGEQGTTGTTPGQTSSSERPTSGEKSTTVKPGTIGTTPGQTSSSETPTSGEKSTTGEQGTTGITPGQTSSSERPTTGEQPNKGTSPGQTSSSESPTSGEKSTTGEQGTTGTTPGQTSLSESPTTGEQPNKGTSPGQTSSSESPTSGEKSTTGEPGTTGTTPGQTSSSESPTTGEQPNKGTSPGQTSSSERPTSGEKSTTGEQGTTSTTPGQTSSSESPTTGEQPNKGTSPGQTSSSERSTSVEKSTTGEEGTTGTTPGQTSSSERPTSEEKSTTDEPGTTGTTPGQTSSSESSTTGEQPNKGTSPGQTSSSERPTSEEKSTTGEQGTTGTTPGQTSSSERPTSGEKSTTGEQGTTGTTPGQTSSSESPTTREQPNKGTSPGQTSSSERPTSGEKSTTGEQGTTGTTPGQTSSSEIPTTGEQPNKGTTPGQTSSSERPTSGEKSTTGEQGTTGTTPGQTSSSESTTSPEQPTTGEQPNKGTPHTTSCFCLINDVIYDPGEIIYKEKDSQGCVFHAVCSTECHIERSLGECTTTESTPTSEDLTSIKDVSSSKPTMTRPSRRPPTVSSSTPYEPETSTDSTCAPCECQMPNCSTGYRVVSRMQPGDCCATILCEPDDVCVADNTIYKPGSTIPQAKNVCQKCECSKSEKDDSGLYAITCQELVCDETCEKGFEYAEKEGECCGECVPKQCTMKKTKVESGESGETGQNGESGEEDSQILIQIGETYRPEGSTCSYYECDEEDGKPVLTKVKKVCQELDIYKCEEGTVKYDEDGCCQTCTYKTEVQIVEKPVVENCSSRKNVTVLKEDNCEVEVELTYCGGPCMGTSMYSAVSQGMDHKCSCCTELEVADREVEMLCANGQRKTHYYKDVIRCGCSVATCEPVASGEIQDSQQINQKYQSISRRRRR